MYFGTREFMTDVRCPAINVIRNREKWTTSGTYLNGGGFARGSAYSHAVYTIAWNLMSPDEARKILDFYNGNYGQGVIYFLDDFALEGNILPLHWSVPRLTVKDAPPLVRGVVISETSLAAVNNAGAYPSASATFSWAGVPNSDSVWIPVPPGQNFYFGVRGSRTGTAEVTLTRDKVAPGVLTNLLTNPSFEATSGTVEVRRNLVSNPRGTSPGALTGFVLAPQWYGGGSATGTTTYVTGAPDGPEVAPGVRLDTYGRKTWTAAGGGRAAIAWQFNNGPRASVTPGSTVTASLFWRRSSSGLLPQNYLAAEFYDALTGGNKIGLTVPGPAHPEPSAGEWQRVSATFVVPAGAVGLALAHLVTQEEIVAVGMTIDASGADVEVSTALLPYMDGSFSPDSDLTASWTGAANASPSVLTGVGVTGVVGGAGRFGISSQQWAASGTRSLRIVSTGASADAFPATIYTFAAGDVGKTFTAIGQCRLAGPTTGNTQTSSRSIFLTGQPDKTNQAANVAGVTDLRLTFTVTASGNQVRLGGGGIAGGGDVWWDNVMLVAGEYTGPYFDGNTANSADWNYAWTGTANASTSQRTGVSNFGTGSPLPTTTTRRTNTVLTDPGGVTISIRGSGSLTLNSMYGYIGTEPPPNGNFRSGEGHTGVVFDGVPQRTGYSAAIGDGLESVSSSFKEVGAWR